MKIQTHCHTLGGSNCARATASQLVEDLKNSGFDGAVITNHYCYNYFKDYPGETKKEKLDFYFSLIDEFERVSDGLKVFYGTEIVAKRADNLYSEYMIYGFDKKFLYDNSPLFELTQEELFRLSEKNNVFMYQTHPFRAGVTLGEAQYMHGAESFNGHVHHHNNNALADEFCEKNDLVKMSGADYHFKGQPLFGGIYIPDGVNDNFALAQALRRGEHKIIVDEKNYQEVMPEYFAKHQEEKKARFK